MLELFKLNIKPLSQNAANGVTKTGRIHKTKEYTHYKYELGFLLPRKLQVPKGPKKLIMISGVSRDTADSDNPVKPFQDILSEFYGFNDREIYKNSAEKRLVDKGKEYIAFNLVALTPEEISRIDQRSKPKITADMFGK